MAFHPPEQYEEWIRDMTGLALSASIIQTDPPCEVLKLTAANGQELLRIPTGMVRDRDSLKELLPPHLTSESITYELRCQLLRMLTENPDHLAECAKKMEAISKLEQEIEKALASLLRARVAPPLTTSQRLTEATRRLCQLVFRLDDATIKRMLA